MERRFLLLGLVAFLLIEVPTSLGELAMLTLIVSTITTLLYVGHATGRSFRRREIKPIARGIDRLSDLRR